MIIVIIIQEYTLQDITGHNLFYHNTNLSNCSHSCSSCLSLQPLSYKKLKPCSNESASPCKSDLRKLANAVQTRKTCTDLCKFFEHVQSDRKSAQVGASRTCRDLHFRLNRAVEPSFWFLKILQGKQKELALLLLGAPYLM